jgi:hypothetical protein
VVGARAWRAGYETTWAAVQILDEFLCVPQQMTLLAGSSSYFTILPSCIISHSMSVSHLASLFRLQTSCKQVGYKSCLCPHLTVAPSRVAGLRTECCKIFWPRMSNSPYAAMLICACIHLSRPNGFRTTERVVTARKEASCPVYHSCLSSVIKHAGRANFLDENGTDSFSDSIWLFEKLIVAYLGRKSSVLCGGGGVSSSSLPCSQELATCPIRNHVSSPHPYTYFWHFNTFLSSALASSKWSVSAVLCKTLIDTKITRR